MTEQRQREIEFDLLMRVKSRLPISANYQLHTLCEELLQGIKELRTERDTAIQTIYDMAYNRSGNLEPFCANSSTKCVDEYGRCIQHSCSGFCWRYSMGGRP